jgi:ribosomal protein S18 acetylase RimI-like enzyme
MPSAGVLQGGLAPVQAHGPYDLFVGGSRTPAVRLAEPSDAPAFGRMLHDFNEEYDEATPGPAVLAARIDELLADGNTVVLLVGDGPDGVAVLRFRRAIWSPGLECYLAELYVVPERRGRGCGRALLTEAFDVARRRGADTMDLGTDETDHAARRLYETMGFTNRSGGEGGPVMYVYERDL